MPSIYAQNFQTNRINILHNQSLYKHVIIVIFQRVNIMTPLKNLYSRRELIIRSFMKLNSEQHFLQLWIYTFHKRCPISIALLFSRLVSIIIIPILIKIVQKRTTSIRTRERSPFPLKLH
jgi:hypothetical protein